MTRLIWTVILSFAIAVALGPVVIPWLKKMKFGQTIYEKGLESHKVKQGTPNMAICLPLPHLLLHTFRRLIP